MHCWTNGGLWKLQPIPPTSFVALSICISLASCGPASAGVLVERIHPRCLCRESKISVPEHGSQFEAPPTASSVRSSMVDHVKAYCHASGTFFGDLLKASTMGHFKCHLCCAFDLCMRLCPQVRATNDCPLAWQMCNARTSALPASDLRSRPLPPARSGPSYRTLNGRTFVQTTLERMLPLQHS